MAERSRHVAHRVLRTVLDDVRHLGGPLPPVLPVHPLDDLLTAVGVEVHVDVRLLRPRGREEALEGKAVEDRIDRGDPQQVADRARRGRPPALAEDAASARLRDDAVHDQEVSGEVLLLDHVQLAFDAAVAGVVQSGVLRRHGLPDQVTQPAHRRVPLRYLLLGECRSCETQREGGCRGQLEPVRDRAGVAPEAGRHLGSAAQMRAAVRGQPAVELIHAAHRADRGHRLGERRLCGGGVVHVVGRDHRQPHPTGVTGEGVVAAGVQRIPVVEELDGDVVGSEQVGEGAQRSGRVSGLEPTAHRTLAASGQDRPVARPRALARSSRS